MGSREEDMAQFAVLADMGDISDRWLEEVFTHAYMEVWTRAVLTTRT
jgi:hypothetical protein